MPHQSPRIFRAAVGGIVLLILPASGAALDVSGAPQSESVSPDSVVARVHEHFAGLAPPIVLAVDSRQFPPDLWQRVKGLIAFRLHRHQPDGTTRVDAATYLVRGSKLYLKAAAALRNNTSNHEYVWCLLAAVVAHEAAHRAPKTEKQALAAEAAQLRRCLFAGHLYTGDGWNPLAYLQAVEARMRKPREHY